MDKTNYLLCSQGSYIVFDVLKTNQGNYIYAYELVVYSQKGSTKGLKGEIKLDGLIFYDIGGFGMTANMESLKTKMDDSVKKLFQDFALDWRKTH